MADPDTSLELKGPTVAASANQCLESFQQCLISASSVHPREVSMVEDQLARFSSWATSIGVFAPGSASMDHRLRYASEVQSVVTGLLESLNYRVQTCSKSLTQLAESLSTDVSITANERLAQTFLDIAAEISRLNKISNTIRRASKDTQVLKASNFQIKDDEGKDVEPLLLSHFEHHIGDWFPGISDTIRQRLARAMLLRRKRILYRRHRQGDTSIRSDNTISQASVTLPDAQAGAGSQVQTQSKQKGEKAAIEKRGTKVAPSQVKSATTLAPEKFKMVSSTPSIVSATRTIASGKHQVLTYPPAPGFAAKRRYEKLKRQRMVEAAETNTEPGLRELLESDLQAIGEITCPYCLYALPAAEVFDERKWQNHVKNDLDPYVCLFENCDQPDILYTHSDEWLGHLHQHGKVWRCSSHREIGPFSTLEEYMRHMREVHDTKLSDRQLRVVANRNSRKATKLFPSCPLCGREESEVDGRLEDHLAGHLRSLALKSLPSYQDEIPDDVEDGNNSIDGSRPRSRSTLRELEEEKEEMLREGAGSFWEHWTPQLTQGISINFLGDVYFELDLGDSEARVASLFFDTMVFKESTENVDDDPILQSILQQQLARIEVIDAGTEDSSDLSVEQEAASSSNAPMGEADRTLTQQPIDSEAADSQTAAPGQDTEVDHAKGGEIPETLVEPTTQAPPATKLDIPADAESASLSNVPKDEMSRQDEVDDPAAQGHANVETVHAQTAAVEKDVEDLFPEGIKGPAPVRPESQANVPAVIEEAGLSNDVKNEMYRLVEEERETTKQLSKAEFQRLKGVDEGNVIEGENMEDLKFDSAFVERVMKHYWERPDIQEEFAKILQAYEREGRPIRAADAQIRALADAFPELLEDENPFLPESASEGKRDAQPKPEVDHHSPPSLLYTGAATPSQQSQTQDTLCRNVLIYGHCRYKDQGCTFNHDPNRNAGPPLPLPLPPSSQLGREPGAAAPSTTTRAYAVTQDPRSYRPTTRDVTRSHRSSSLDSASRPPVIITTTQKDQPNVTTSQSPNPRSGTPIRDEYRSSEGQFYTQPASSIHSRGTTHSYADQAGPYSPYGRAPSGGSSAMPSLLTTYTDSPQPQHMEASRASSGVSVEAAGAERDYYRQNPYQPTSQSGTNSPEKGHRYPPIPETNTTGPPGAPPTSFMSLEQDEKRASSIYVNGKMVLNLDRRDRPLTKGQSPSSSFGKASGGRSYSKQPTRPATTFDNQASAASAPQDWYTGVPRDSKAHQHDMGSTSVPMAIHQPANDNYYPYPPAERDPTEPLPYSHPSAYYHPDDAFEADVEDDIPRPKNPRRKTRPAIYLNGEMVGDLNRENSPVGSRRERIVIVDNPKEQEAAEAIERYQAELERLAMEDPERTAREQTAIEAVERYKQGERERIAQEKAELAYENQLRADLAKSDLDAEAIDAIMEEEKAKIEARRAARERETAEDVERYNREGLERIAKAKAEKEAREREAVEAVERYKQAELERIAKVKAEKAAKDKESEKRLREDHAKAGLGVEVIDTHVKRERARSRSRPRISMDALPYDTIGPRRVIVEERPRVKIEIVDGPLSRRPRHASHDPRSTPLKKKSTRPRHASHDPRSVYILDDDEEEELRQRRLERRRRRELEERFEEERLRARNSDSNAETSGRRPSTYRRPAVDVLDPEAKKEGKEKGPSVVDFDSEAELIEAVRRINAEQERYEKETGRLSQKEEGKGKEKEGEEKQPSVKDPDRELREATRRLNTEEARREERARRDRELREAILRLNAEEARREERARRLARKEETEEDEIQRRRLMERMEPRRRDVVGGRRSRVLYDDGVYRWE